jgi:hypothetical protein
MFLGVKIKPINHPLKQPFSWEFEISKFLNISKRKYINGTQIQLRFTKHFHGLVQVWTSTDHHTIHQMPGYDSVVNEAPRS